MGSLTDRPTILPPNASKLQRAIDQAAPQWDTLPRLLQGNTYGHPDALAPWLAAEWGISQFARYFNGNTGAWLRLTMSTAMRWPGCTRVHPNPQPLRRRKSFEPVDNAARWPLGQPSTRFNAGNLKPISGPAG